MPSLSPINEHEVSRRFGLMRAGPGPGFLPDDWAVWDDGAHTASTPEALAAAALHILALLPGHRTLMGNAAAATALQSLLANEQAWSVTGTRRSTPEADLWFSQLAIAWSHLGECLPLLVHGGAAGTDQALAAAWRSIGGGEIIVLGGGLAHARDAHPLRWLFSITPGSSAAGLSLCPPAQPPDAASLVRRNRLIALLGSCLLVGQVSGGRGGAWHTIKAALEFQRPLFRLPDTVAESGESVAITNDLREGQQRLHLAGARGLPSDVYQAARSLSDTCATPSALQQSIQSLIESAQANPHPDLFADL